MTHQRLFFEFRLELKQLCRDHTGGFRETVRVDNLLNLEQRYAEAETAMMKADRKRVMESA